MKFRNYINILAISFLTLGLFQSCSELLTTDANEVLLTDQVYQSIDDADAALRGIYGKMMDVANQYIVLNELRADLMSVTTNADLSLIELSEHRTITDGNKWADPKPFFSLINSCNDAIHHFNTMVAEDKISKEAYEIRYSDAVAIRCWAYLQVSIHFSDLEKGGVPYITKPLNEIDNLTDEYLSQFPYLNLETMIDSLVASMDAIPFKGLTTDESLITTMNGNSTKYMFIDKQYLLGELNLWDGNYLNAAIYFKTIMERASNDPSNPYDPYKLPFDASATLNISTCRYNSGYVRYAENDRRSAKNMWPYMFFDDETSNYSNEWLWVLYFDELYEPNTFIDLFSKTGGNYLLKPSNLAVSNWNKQVQRNTFKGDMRGFYDNYFGLPGSFYYDLENDPIILKQIYEYTVINSQYNPLEKVGKWHLWRAGGLHLHYAEAANRDGQHRVAYAITNNGINANYPGTDTLAASSDYTKRGQTFLPFPYDFDARSTGLTDLPPNLRQPWFRNTGVRGRVYLESRTVEGDSLSIIETQILEESALELAFEGQRWADLVRIAMRNNDNSILADKIADKLNSAGLDGEAVRAKLMDRNNWFIPIKL